MLAGSPQTVRRSLAHVMNATMHRSTAFPQPSSLLYPFDCDEQPRYSGGAIPSPSMDSKRVEFLRNARFTRPVGPLRCLAMMSSALP